MQTGPMSTKALTAQPLGVTEGSLCGCSAVDKAVPGSHTQGHCPAERDLDPDSTNRPNPKS